MAGRMHGFGRKVSATRSGKQPQRLQRLTSQFYLVLFGSPECSLPHHCGFGRMKGTRLWVFWPWCPCNNICHTHPVETNQATRHHYSCFGVSIANSEAESHIVRGRAVESVHKSRQVGEAWLGTGPTSQAVCADLCEHVWPPEPVTSERAYHLLQEIWFSSQKAAGGRCCFWAQELKSCLCVGCTILMFCYCTCEAKAVSLWDAPGFSFGPTTGTRCTMMVNTGQHSSGSRDSMHSGFCADHFSFRPEDQCSNQRDSETGERNWRGWGLWAHKRLEFRCGSVDALPEPTLVVPAVNTVSCRVAQRQVAQDPRKNGVHIHLVFLDDTLPVDAELMGKHWGQSHRKCRVKSVSYAKSGLSPVHKEIECYNCVGKAGNKVW